MYLDVLRMPMETSWEMNFCRPWLVDPHSAAAYSRVAPQWSPASDRPCLEDLSASFPAAKALRGISSHLNEAFDELLMKFWWLEMKSKLLSHLVSPVNCLTSLSPFFSCFGKAPQRRRGWGGPEVAWRSSEDSSYLIFKPSQSKWISQLHFNWIYFISIELYSYSLFKDDL